MTQAIHLRRSKPLTALLADLLDCEVPEDVRRKLAGLRADGRRIKGRPKKGCVSLPPGAKFGDALVLSLVMRSLSGDTFATKLVVSMIEGLPARRMEFSGSVAHADVSMTDIRAKLMLFMNEKPALMEKPEPVAELVEHHGNGQDHPDVQL